MLKAKGLRNLSKEELKAKADALYQDLLKLNQQRYSGRVEKPHQFRQVRKDIARIMTVLNEISRSEK